METQNSLSSPETPALFGKEEEKDDQEPVIRARDVSLDLSFGDTPMEFQRVNLLGSRLQQAAIYSLVLSLNTVTYLDLRGNNLDATFGWRLIKAMKKRYLQLEFCNGVNTRAVRDNAIEHLNLAGFEMHSGLYGIEVVGAIFLAHFLRLNSSLKTISFRRNQVEKDGAKALAQSMIGNTNCQIRSVNSMGIRKKERTGIDFRLFRKNQLTEVNLAKTGIDDDDVVFLEEWLLRHDCTTELNLSNNHFTGEGVRKLHRYILNSKTLLRLKLDGVPLDLEGVSLMAKALGQNVGLEQASFPTRACLGIQKEKQVVMHSLAVSIAKHPKLQSFGVTPLKVSAMRNDAMADVNTDRIFASSMKSEISLYFWLLAVLCPSSKTDFKYGGAKTNFANEYPSVTPYPVSFCPALNNCLHECRNILTKVNLAIPPSMDGLAVQIMRHLRSSRSLRDLKLPGYAAATISEVPPDWASDGRLPAWIRDKLTIYRKHWQVLHSFLSEVPNLDVFGNVHVSNYDADSAERAFLLLLECCPGVVCQLGDTTEDEDTTQIVLSLTCGRVDLKLPFIFDCFRLVDKLVYNIDVHFLDDKALHVDATQQELAQYLIESEGNKSIPPFVHTLRLKSQTTAPEIIECCKVLPNIKEFGLERVETLLEILVNAYTDAESKQQIEQIRIDRKWLRERRIPKLFSEEQRDQLLKLQQAIGTQSPEAFSILTSSVGTLSKEDLVGMTLTEFASAVGAVSVDGWAQGETYDPQVYVPCVTSPKEYYFPESSGGKWDKGQYYPDDLGGQTPLAFELPITDTSLNLRKVSLCMVGLKRLIADVRCDEWPATSRTLWANTGRCTLRPGQYLNDDLPCGGMETVAEMDFDGSSFDPAEVAQFHWDTTGVQLGTDSIMERAAAGTENFQGGFLRTCLESLLTSQTITSLDLRGNGLDKNDCLFIISLLEKNTTLLTLNQIPVVIDEAQKMAELRFDHHGIPIPSLAEMEEEESGETDENCIYCATAFSSTHVELDEGDGYLFASLVTETNFPSLSSIRLREHAVSDATLAYICDALLALPALENLDFTDMKLSNRGANLLLSAVSEIAGRLRSVNGIPLGRLLEEKKSTVGGGGKGAILAGDIVWNDFSLGLLSRLKLWPHVVWPEPSTQPVNLEGHTLTDVGVRGICGLLKCFTPGPDSAPKARSLPQLTDLNLSRNPSLTDAAVAVLCKQLSVEQACPTLRRLSVRYCPKLRSRSAFELYQLLRTKIALTSFGEARGSRQDSDAGLKNLTILNGIDIGALSEATAQGKPLPPAVIRVDIDQAVDTTILSECDAHYFAHVLHTFPAIPHCHVHMLVSSKMEVPADVDAYSAMLKQRRLDVARSPSTNNSPFTQPIFVATKLQRELQEVVRFFRACPVSMKLQLSVIPKIPAEQGMHIQDDGTILLMQNQQDMETTVKAITKTVHVNTDGPSGIFRHLVEKLVKRRRNRLAREKAANGGRGSTTSSLGGDEEGAKRPSESGATPSSSSTAAKPLYVNNINSQRMHDCFRTLYGTDDVHLFHNDVYSDVLTKNRISFPSVDSKVIADLLGTVSSLDIQHLFLSNSPLSLGPLSATDNVFSNAIDLASLTHLNLANNSLGDTGVVDLFTSLVKCGSTVVHISVQANQISDISAVSIAYAMQSLPRLSSLNLSENNITETGAITLAESIGGSELHASEVETSLLQILSIDLGYNRVRELGALRFAEMVAMHPTIQLLCLCNNEIAVRSEEAFTALVYAAAASAALAVLDLRGNFEDGKKVPPELVKKLLAEPLGDFDPAELEEGVLIRRK
ncbi:unnamed protein product [Amoebophrya sp. A25]|nr:unnamed protein product [Amoebophrya sp. A25]|eukprot:GSA25T00016530001.1